MEDKTESGILLGIGLFVSSALLGYWNTRTGLYRHSSSKPSLDAELSYMALIGNTPLVELKYFSELYKCRIMVKMESLNPGGTGKDRAAKYMLQEAIKEYDLLRNKRPIVEGTSGSTGIALAYICKALQLPLHVVLPDDQAEEKKALLERLGASVTIVPTCAISNKDHYVNTARRMAKDLNGVFMDQFDNLANFKAHHEQTGPEIWNQCHGNIDCFVMSAGTGGTIAGVSNYLKNKSKKIQIILADPTGSSLLSKVKYNVCYTAQQSERKIKKHRYDSIVEGVGLDRITKNFNLAVIDDAYSVTDQEVLDTAHVLLQREGLFVGSSSSLNIAVALKLAASNEYYNTNKTIVTVVCDAGQRHLSRFWNPLYVHHYNLLWPTGSTTS